MENCCIWLVIYLNGTPTFSRLPFTGFIDKVPGNDIDESISTSRLFHDGILYLAIIATFTYM